MSLPDSQLPNDAPGLVQPPASPLLPPVGQAAVQEAMPADTRGLEFRARLLILFMLVLVCGSAFYVLYARGAFDSTQRLVLVAEDSEGVVAGMDLTFAGFPIGRVRRIELAEDGKARILVDVAEKDAHWLRASSVFTLVKGLVGGPKIRAYSGLMNDPPMPPNAVREVLQGDASAEIPKVLSAAKELIENLGNLTASSGAVATTLANLQTTTARLNGPGGALTVLLGSQTEAKKIAALLDRSQSLATRLDGMASRADSQMFGDKGVLPEAKAAAVQLNAMLLDVRGSLKKVDAILVDAQGVASNAKEATTDLGVLRGDVEASLRRVDGLVLEINRKWPFARDAELKLP